MKRFVLALSFALSGAVISALASEMKYPTQVFDATYETKDATSGSHTTRMISDGKGHMRVEAESSGQKATSIMDYPNNLCTTLIEAQHMAIKMPMRQSGEHITDEASAKKANAKPLGEKTIDGHPCHGYEHAGDGATSRVWIGDDIHYLVRSETITPNGTMAMDLKTWSSKAPSQELFLVPPGYKEMKMPVGMNK